MYFNSSKGAWFQGSPGFVPTWLCDVWWKSTGKPRDPNETWCFRRKGHTPKKTPLVQSSREDRNRRAGWGFSLICGLSQTSGPSKMGTYHWEGHQVFLIHICRVQSQVPFSGVCAHLRDLKKNGTGTYHWEVMGICVQNLWRKVKSW